MGPSDTRRLVDPELLPLLDAWPQVALTTEILGEIRAMSRLPLAEATGEAALVELTLVEVPGPEGAPPVALRLYRPAGLTGPLPTIFHIHGGGYVMGAAAAQEPQHRQMAVDLGCVIAATDYRLAPETPAPGSVEDCYASLAWLVAKADELGVNASRIGVMGESAGGGLAAALALLCRDRGGPALAFQHLIYPMLDDRTCIDPMPHPHAGEFIWTRHNNHFGWSALLGHEPGRGDVSPYAAPARATNLRDLPPTFISSGALDLFVEEDIDYARRLIRSGVPVELHVYPGGFHGFDFDPAARVALQARSDSLAALRRALHA